MKNFTRAIVLLTFFTALSAQTFAAVFIAETHVNVSCNGGTNGSIDITPSGGSAPYTYLWNGGTTTQDRTGIAAGTYTVTVADFFGVTASASITVTEPTVISVSKSITGVFCGGGNTGAIALTVSGGTAGYTYLWNDGITTQNRSSLTAAVYYVTITDSRGCTKVDSANVTQPAGMVLSRTTTNVTCGSGANGAINLTVLFGVPGYTYLWNDGANTEDRTGIAAGNYVVTVTDASGCTASLTATVSQSGAGMTVNTSSAQPSCNGGSNGTINVTSVTGSVGPYTFAWNDGPTTQNRTGISAGSYTVTATSTTGCTAAATVNVSQPTALNVTLNVVALTCFGSNNGAINTTSTGGTSPYTYNWGGGVFTQNRTGLASGTFTVTVTDFKSCTATASAFVPEPLVLTATAVPSPLACTGGPTGSVMTNIIGGTGPYTYWWGSGVVTPNRVNVNSGTYTVTVTDAHGCSSVASATVLPYTPMTATTTQANVTCFGAASGSINLTVSNGWTPYSYTWSNGAVVQDPSGLVAGTYTVTISDNLVCSITKTVTITQPAFGMNISSTVVDAACFGYTNGTINITVTNGATPYSYNWGGGILTQNRTALASGNYVVTVTDNSGCSISSSIAVNQPNAISVSPTVTNATCFGANTGAINLAVSGSFAPYTYSWNGGITTQNRTGLFAGNYSVTVTDNRSCTATSSATISQPTLANLNVSVGDLTCFNSNNGWVNLAVSGGSSPYNYNWGGGITSQNRSALGAGTYSVTVMDNAGCTYSASAVINQPAAINVSSSITNASCFGGNNGAINLAVTGGTSPYTYLWNSGAIAQNRTNLSAAAYSVTVTDYTGCTAAHTATVGQATSLSIIPVVTNVSCNSGTNGAITLTVTGATAPYSFNWGGGVVTQNRTTLSSGNYVVTVTDNAGCTASNSSNLTQPTAIAVTSTVTNATCFGGTNGSIIIGVSGGTSPYAFNWGGGIISQNRNTLLAGNYTVIVTDNAGCTTTNSSTVSQGTAIVISPTVTNATCNGGSTGAINIGVNGGVSPYTFNWGGGIVTQNRTSLLAGNYVVTVTDNSSCTASSSSSINQPSAISASSTTTNVACNGGNNGAITLTVTGGTSPFTFNWGGGVLTQNRTNLISGSYTVTITDNASCTSTHTATISQTTSLSVSSTVTNSTCNGGNNGAITITTTGGTTPYSYNWGGGIISQNRTALLAGSYTVTVSDNAGCTSANTAVVGQPIAITITPTVTNVACVGGNTGAVNISVNGGTSPYTFNWGGGIISQNRTSVAAGNYSVTVTDNASCTATNTSTVIQLAALAVTPVVTNVSCNGGNNGAITITANGGTAPYTYNWGGGVFTQNRTNLSAATYTVTVIDNAGCSGTNSSVVTQPSAISATANITNVSCNGGNNGAIALTANGGTSPYSFAWAGGAVTQNRVALAQGSYAVTITDNNSCTFATSATVTQPAVISLSTTKVDVACFGAATGSINLTVAGGTSPYTYLWTNAAQTQNISSLVANSYSVTVNDANSCTATTSASISQATQITTSVSSINASCFGSNTGSIDLSVSGGTGAYTYVWSNAATTQDVTSVAANTYTVTVKDASNCTVLANATITQPTQIVLSNTKVNVLCNGGNNASIDLTVTGGSSPFTYAWSNAATSQDISTLIAGTYTVSVNDNNWCSASSSIVISQPALLTVIAAQTNVSCSGGNNGSITLTVAGGTSPFNYNWGGGVVTPNRTSLTAGNYSVIVTDANACSVNSSTSITQPAPLVVTYVKTDVVCNGAISGSIDVSVSGGATPYVYHWNNNATMQDLWNAGAGTYGVTITDANACSSAVSVAIVQPSPLTVSVIQTNVNCYGGTNGAITANASGGNGGYIFNWSNGGNTATITNLSGGSYTLSLSDAAACATTLSLSITQPSQIVLTETHTNILCNGGNNGAINLSVNGGTTPYFYNWSNSATSQDISSITSGNYSVIVTDGNSCTASLTATITEPATLSVSTSATNVVCNGASTGAVSSTVSGGTSPYVYNWINNATTSNISNVIAGNYSVTVTDANACSAVSSSTITQATAISVSLSKTDATCFGNSNGSITTTVSGGNAGYTFNWSNGAITQNIGNLAAATYTVTVMDASNCSVVSSIAVAQPTQVTTTETHVNVSCNGGNNASINITPAGGTGAYSFSWSNAAVSQNVNGLNAGSYTVTIADANSCTTTKTIAITQPAILSLSETHTAFACSTNAGAIDLTVAGGTTPYTYNWTNAATTQDINNLAAANYTVVVTDANACTSTTSVSITALVSISTSLSKTDVLCNGAATGAVSVYVTGGTMPFSYNWTNGSLTQNLNNVTAGIYSVVVVDANNCSSSASSIITEPSALAINPTINHVSCFGGNNGSISLSTTGGVSPYTFAWSNNSSTTSVSSLLAANYAVTVVDANSCATTIPSIAVNQPSALELTENIIPVGCSGRNDGEIHMSASGGTPPYSFMWNTAHSDKDLLNLPVGNYGVTVTDNNSCVMSKMEIVGMAPALSVTSTVKNTACAQVQNGQIDLTVSGGTPSYVFRWSNGETTPSINDLAQGNYDVTIADSRNCSAQANFTVTYDYDLQVDATNSTTINLGESLKLTATTNTDHANVYSWTPTQNVICTNCQTTDVVPTFTTHYTVNVMDANGCKASDTLTVEVNSITDIFVPNAFTPNGDGNNDELKIYGDVNTIVYLDFAVFNRWGEKVFESMNANFSWDGTYQGEALPKGVFIYTMKAVFINGYSRDYKGSLTVIK